MWIRFTLAYFAGMITGAGLLLFFMALAIDAGMLNFENLRGVAVKFGAIAMILAGGGMQWRSQLGSKLA
jgi:hypothetical protein